MLTEIQNRTWTWNSGWILLFLVIVVYPLSIGPVAWLADRGILSGMDMQRLETLYAPPVWVAEQTGMMGIYRAYFVLWLGGVDYF